MRTHKKQHGYTLIELLIALGVILIGTYLIFGRGQAASTDNKSINFQTEVSVLLTASGKVRQSGDYTGISAAEICRFLAETACPGGVITHSASGTITPSATTVGGLSHINYVITNVPAKACVTTFTGLQSQMTGITVGSTVVKSPTVPFTEKELSGACSAATQSVTFDTRA